MDRGGLCVSRWPGRGAGVLALGGEGRGRPADRGLEAAWEVGLALGLPPASRPCALIRAGPGRPLSPESLGAGAHPELSWGRE